MASSFLDNMAFDQMMKHPFKRAKIYIAHTRGTLKKQNGTKVARHSNDITALSKKNKSRRSL